MNIVNFNRAKICNLLKVENPKIIEIGVEYGGFTEEYYDTISLMNGHIWLLDLWQTENNDWYFSQRQGQVEDGYKKILEKYSDKKNVTIIKGSSFELYKYFDDDFFDWIYLDADHSYDGIKKDVINWIPKLKKGGILSGHDYNADPNNIYYENFGVNKAIDEIFGKDINLTNEEHYQSWFINKK